MYTYTTDPITGTFEMDTAKDARLQEADSHQVSYRNGTCTTGTAKLKVKPLGSSTYEDLTVGGVAVTRSMSSDWTFGMFSGLYSAIKVDVTGADGNFKFSFAGK